MIESTDAASPWRRTIGIVGGLGPFAHLELERRLLAAVPDPRGDQSFPPLVVSSIPQTPDRTAALLDGGPSPVPLLVASLERLQAAGADFAVIACHSAHAFLDPVRERVTIPILDLVEEAVLRGVGGRRRATFGLLATTGTLEAELFPRAAERLGLDVTFLSPLDLPDGRRRQERLVMAALFGPRGLKATLAAGSGHRRQAVTSLRTAAELLAARGVDAIVMGCTEIPLALGRQQAAGVPLLDSLAAAADAALAIARGERPLPGRDGRR